MTKYIIQRLLAALPVLLGILFVTFALARLLPGDPCVAMLGEKANDVTCAAFNARYGLDKPIVQQFGIYLKDVLTGDLGIWLFEYLAGIKADPAKPGFRHIIMHPYPVGGLSYVLAAHKSQLGAIISGWQLDNAKFEWWLTVPPNTTATVHVPATKVEDVLEGDKKAADAQGVKFLRMENGRVMFEVESGEYHFINPHTSPTSRPAS